MDVYFESKSRWRPFSKTWRGGSRRCRCSWCSTRGYSRHATKTLWTKDLEAEYLKGNHTRSNSATAFCDWFYAHDVEAEEEGLLCEELIEMFGEEKYRELLREHIEAEKQLKQNVLASVETEESGAPEAQGRNVEAEVFDLNEETWDVISTTSEDWEKVALD